MADENTKTKQGNGFAVAVGVSLGLMLAGVGAYFWLVFARWADLQHFAAAGDAVGPFAGMATVGALLAALWSVKLQREELQLQLIEMRESVAHLAKTAEQQEALAVATSQLATAQDKANRLALRAEHAQRSATAAAIRGSIIAASAALQASGHHNLKQSHAEILGSRKKLEEHLEDEIRMLDTVRSMLTIKVAVQVAEERDEALAPKVEIRGQ